jgi:hypothetical protein
MLSSFIGATATCPFVSESVFLTTEPDKIAKEGRAMDECSA